MKITLNHREEEFEQDGMTVSELLKVKKFTFRLLVIKINQQLIKKEQYATAQINDGDDVIVYHMISGG